MPDKPTPMASMAAGQIAIQTMLSLLVNLYIGESVDPEQARRKITDMAEQMVDKALIPDLPAADQKAARASAKALVRALIGGQHRN